jgi:hypothetical protein
MALKSSAARLVPAAATRVPARESRRPLDRQKWPPRRLRQQGADQPITLSQITLMIAAMVP